jgi:alkylation response protein AidB-like acyl-CoA dehydrogenase
MSSVLLSRDLLEFQLFDWLQIDRDSDIDRETATAMIEMASRLAEDAFLPHYRAADTEEPQMTADGATVHPTVKTALRQYAEMGLFGASFPEDLGGLGLPSALASGVHSIFASANVSTAGYAMLTGANARLITQFGTPRQIEQFALPQIEGRWFGTMCLSEPQAGSSLADITTRAQADGEDEFGARYRISGNKMWISGGDQDASENIVHLVLAKAALPGEPLPHGAKGISLFIVPKILPDGTRNDISLAGLNHKMGNRGTTNCLLNFGENGGAIGWRVGEEGQGLAQMFMMMNEARIGVGMGAAVLGYRGYRHSVAYAKDRVQGRKLGSREKSSVPIIEHADVRRMLLQQKSYSEIAIAICLFCSHLQGKNSEESELLLGILTPIAKSWPSEFGLIANDLAIQVHGGCGYTRDFDVEQLWRDNRLNPIHEGTTGIQGLDLLGRKILRSDGAPLTILTSKIAETIARAERGETFAAEARIVRAYWAEIEATIEGLRSADGTKAYNDATLFLRAFGHGVAAWIWLDLSLSAEGTGSPDRLASATYVLRYFTESELPLARSWLSIVSQHLDTAAVAPDEVFQ